MSFQAYKYEIPRLPPTNVFHLFYGCRSRLLFFRYTNCTCYWVTKFLSAFLQKMTFVNLCKSSFVMTLIFVVTQWTMVFPEKKEKKINFLSYITILNYNFWNFRCLIRCVSHTPRASKNGHKPVWEPNFFCVYTVTTGITGVSRIIPFIFFALHSWILGSGK